VLVGEYISNEVIKRVSKKEEANFPEGDEICSGFDRFTLFQILKRRAKNHESPLDSWEDIEFLVDYILMIFFKVHKRAAEKRGLEILVRGFKWGGQKWGKNFS